MFVSTYVIDGVCEHWWIQGGIAVKYGVSLYNHQSSFIYKVIFTNNFIGYIYKVLFLPGIDFEHEVQCFDGLGLFLTTDHERESLSIQQ